MPLKQLHATMPALSEETGMDLLLWRHAEAEEGIPDLKRRLSRRGEKQAAQMADWIRKNGPKKLRILVSPALRCQQTAGTLELPFDTDRRLGTEGQVSDLLAAINWPDGCNEGRGAVLVVGHQPTLGQTAALLLSGEEADWTIKKGALWWFSNRVRRDETQTVLLLAISANFLE